MSHGYVPVQWNKRKKVYDFALWSGCVLYMVLFMLISKLTYTGDQALSTMTLLLRAFATLALVLLTIILCTGPLARLDQRFLPMLYNRRHMGVTLFFVALAHALLVMIWYHGYGVIDPIVSIFSSPGSYLSLADIPFQPFGFFALIILFVMAATSHDYWNANLGATLWKALHMLVYLAYALVVAHVALGSMQDQGIGLLPAIVLASVLLVGGLHVIAALVSRDADQQHDAADWVDVGSWRHIENNFAVTVSINDDERVAVFRYDETKLAAVSNVCKHQGGPLGEGKVIRGCITCPWHGFQYRPEDGQSPPPFKETIATYELALRGDRVMLNPKALPERTRRPVLEIPLAKAQQENDDV